MRLVVLLNFARALSRKNPAGVDEHVTPVNELAVPPKAKEIVSPTAKEYVVGNTKSKMTLVVEYVERQDCAGYPMAAIRGRRKVHTRHNIKPGDFISYISQERRVEGQCWPRITPFSDDFPEINSEFQRVSSEKISPFFLNPSA